MGTRGIIHYPIHAMIQENEIVKYFLPCEEKKEEVDRMEAKDRCAEN